jgi:hypothetical protein
MDMIIVKLKGGLGNQLFQYAFGRLLSVVRDEELALDTGGLREGSVTSREYALEPFAIRARLADAREAAKARYPLGFLSQLSDIFRRKVLRSFNIGWNPKLVASRRRYFEGFFQSHKYLDPIRPILLREIALTKPLSEHATTIALAIGSCNSVSIHIRRGDYVHDAKTHAAHYTFGTEYYENALRALRERMDNPSFFVFSDDIAWAKENLKTGGHAVFVSDQVGEAHEELILMSMCRHNIIANSSFSFWGAWLNQNPDKIVVAPKRWNNAYPEAYNELLPQEWVQL